jgi:S-phase kinase-associated protein 1
MSTKFEDPIILQSSDNIDVTIEREVLGLSETIKNLLEDCSPDENGDIKIPLPNVDGATVTKLEEYLNYHNQHPTEHSDYEGKGLDEIGPWDLEYCKGMNNGVLFKVILASNYLDIKPLLHLTCKTVAKKIKGKKPSEIKEILKIEVDE